MNPTPAPVVAELEEDDSSFFADPRFAWNIDKSLAAKLGADEIGFLVECYYELQKSRLRALGRDRALSEQTEPSALARAYGDQFAFLESRTKALLKTWCDSNELATWAMKVVGIGPVIAAGLGAHIRPEKAATPSSVFRFAGLDPTAVWAKGEKRPWNAKLKVLVWKIGQQFMKLGERYPQSLYARVYREEKARRVDQNATGAYAPLAATTLASKKFTDKKTRELYESGHLPDGRIELQAERKAVKLFLAHYWLKSRLVAGLPTVRPWVIEHGGHAHEIPPEVPY